MKSDEFDYEIDEEFLYSNMYDDAVPRSFREKYYKDKDKLDSVSLAAEEGYPGLLYFEDQNFFRDEDV